MGWFARRNVTRRWEERSVPLVLDLDALTLAGLECGDPADGLSFLGPGEPGVLPGEFLFPAHGVTLDIEGDDLRGVHAHIRPTADEREQGIRPYRGEVRHRRAAVDAACVDEAAAVERFGAADVVEEGGGRRVLTYLTDGSEWELVFDADGRLAAISLY